jgi:NAD(P)-dependent dehydrogenase (short-subunit alcohol dehydrogenase family)
MAAQGFIQNGARVFIASRKESELKKTTDRLNGLGPGKCEYIVADLKDKAGCDGLVNELKRRTDRLTVLVNNTGATWGASYYDFPEAGWDKLMALNVKSVFYMTVGLEPLLLKGTSPDMPSRVINIASMAGIMTSDVTTTDDGGLSAPGHGTYSCMFATDAEALNNADPFPMQMAPRKQLASISPKCKHRNWPL